MLPIALLSSYVLYYYNYNASVEGTEKKKGTV